MRPYVVPEDTQNPVLQDCSRRIPSLHFIPVKSVTLTQLAKTPLLSSRMQRLCALTWYRPTVRPCPICLSVCLSIWGTWQPADNEGQQCKFQRVRDCLLHKNSPDSSKISFEKKKEAIWSMKVNISIIILVVIHVTLLCRNKQGRKT